MDRNLFVAGLLTCPQWVHLDEWGRPVHSCYAVSYRLGDRLAICQQLVWLEKRPRMVQTRLVKHKGCCADGLLIKPTLAFVGRCLQCPLFSSKPLDPSNTELQDRCERSGMRRTVCCISLSCISYPKRSFVLSSRAVLLTGAETPRLWLTKRR